VLLPSNSTFNVPDRVPIPCTRTGGSFRWSGVPLHLIFVSAGSRARHRADPCKTRFGGGSPRCCHPTTRSTCRIGCQSLAHEPGNATREDRRGFANPLARIFVSAGSRARHRADPCKNRAPRRLAALPESNNTLNVPHRANPLRTNRVRSRERIAVASRTRWPGFSWRLDQGLAIGQTPAKTGLRGGSPRYRNPTARSTCRIGCQSLAHEPGNATREDRRGSANPLARIFVSAGSGARHRADPCKTRFGGPLCHLETNNTLTVSRALLGDPHPWRGWRLCHIFRWSL
jgi:hypothetical protein